MNSRISKLVLDINSGRFGRNYVAITATYGGTVLFPGHEEEVSVSEAYFKGPEEGGCLLHLFRQGETGRYEDMGFLSIKQDGVILDHVVDPCCKGLWSDLVDIYIREAEFESVAASHAEISRETASGSGNEDVLEGQGEN